MSRTVLVVDDEPDILLAARLMLEAAGCMAIEAGSGEEALELVETETMNVEAVFLDLRMPGLGGWGVLEELRAKRISGLPVIILSAYFDPFAVEESAELGAAGYLSKPFTAADLTGVLEAIFEPASDSNRIIDGSVGTQ
jgi:CheY-like chemotaxis protein